MISSNIYLTRFLTLQAFSQVGVAQVTTRPTSFGYILFPAFELLDVSGPLDTLNLLAINNTINLSLIAETLDPVTTKLTMATPGNSYFAETIVPTHTFATAPEVDVLFVPGGPGTRAPNLNSTIDFVKDRYPRLQYLITVFTGAGIAARAGVLDGRRATTNKRAWVQTTALGPKVKWIAKARWVEDGNIWTSSGVTAGIDATLAWIDYLWGSEVAQTITDILEYRRVTDWRDDPFAALYGLSDANNTNVGL